MATPKQVQFYNELIGQGRQEGPQCRQMGNINDADPVKAWHCIGELLGTNGSAEATQDSSYNDKMVNDYQDAKKADFDKYAILDNAKNNFKSFEEAEQYLKNEGVDFDAQEFSGLRKELKDWEWLEQSEQDDIRQEVEQDYLDEHNLDYDDLTDEQEAEILKLQDEALKDYKIDDYSGEYYSDYTDYNAYSKSIIKSAKDAEYLDREALKEQQVIDAVKLKEDGLIRVGEFTEKGMPEALNNILPKRAGKVTDIDFTASNSTTSSYLTIDTEETTLNVAFGDHYIDYHGNITPLEPDKIETDYKTGGAEKDDSQILKLGTFKGGINLEAFYKLIDEAINDTMGEENE